MKDKQRVSLYLNDEEQAAFNIIKQHYGITSNATAGRRAIVEHAKQIKLAEEAEQRVTYSRRVH